MIKAILFIIILTINYFALFKEVEWCQYVFLCELLVIFATPVFVAIIKFLE